MLKLRQVGAPRIVPSRRVVLDNPYVTSDGVVTAHSLPEGGVVVKIDKKTLKEVWRKKIRLHLRGGYDDLIFLYYGSEAQVWNNDAKILWKPSGPFGIKNGRLLRFGEGDLSVLDPYTGKLLERLEYPQGLPKLFVEDERVLLLAQDDFQIDPVRAFSFAGRRIRWEKNLAAEIRERYEDKCERGVLFVGSSQGRFLAGTGRHVLAFSLADGQLVWGRHLRTASLIPAIRDGRLYAWATSGESAHHTTMLDTTTGQVTRATIAPANGENRFVIVDESTGEVLVDRPLAPYGEPFRQFQEPRGTLCKHHIVYVNRAGLIVVLRLSDGEMVWHQQHAEQLYWPAVDGNRLFFPCVDGTLVVFEAEGEEL